MEELLEQVVSLSNINEIIDFISGELKKPVILESASKKLGRDFIDIDHEINDGRLARSAYV